MNGKQTAQLVVVKGIVLTLGVLLAALSSLGAAPAAGHRPNVLIIHVDQLRFDCLGSTGNPDVRTPNIDRLARDGVSYINSFCSFPVCTPSRYSLLSGRFVHDHAGWDNRSTLSPQIGTFPKVFRAAGYRTAAVGKMHFTPTYLDVGFDEMQLAEQDGPGRWDDDYHRYLMKLGLYDRNDLEDQLAEYRKDARPAYRQRLGALVSNLPEAHHSTTWIADRAIESLRTWDKDKPSLLMVGFIKPHHPFDPPTPWDSMYDPQKLTILPGWVDKTPQRDVQLNRGYFPNDEMTETALRGAMAYYYATISQIDHHVGRMLELLRQQGLYDDTLIIFTADHGEYLGFHHMLLKSNHMYDPLVKVPLFIKWPAQRDAGKTTSRLVSNVDIAPTLCRAAGLPGLEPPAGNAGEDLSIDAPGRQIIFCESGPNQVMARTSTHKLLLVGKPPRQTSYFFDLSADPPELNDLSATPAAQEEIKRLTAAIAAWRPGPLPERYLDLSAPQIHGPNVPPPGLAHRQATMDYYQSKMHSPPER